MQKLKSTKKAKDELKAELIRKQKGKCPISSRSITLSTSVLDHDHTTGVIRAALPRGVNGIEGKIKNLVSRWAGAGTTDELIKFLRNLADYYELHKTPQTGYIYPTHKTPEEKREKRLKKQRAAYAKKKKLMKEKK